MIQIKFEVNFKLNFLVTLDYGINRALAHNIYWSLLLFVIGIKWDLKASKALRQIFSCISNLKPMVRIFLEVGCLLCTVILYSVIKKGTMG